MREFNPDDELVAIRHILAVDFAQADHDDRAVLLNECGVRLKQLGRFLSSREAYAPRWPSE